jgi:hypothetical protein
MAESQNPARHQRGILKRAKPKINTTGAVGAEGNQELFIFKKREDGKWGIARYGFSTTNPA